VPPCILLKSDGASLYTTTDLATIVMRMKDSTRMKFCMSWTSGRRCTLSQVFRCARKTGIVSDDVKLSFLGFGTMNGKDGKPFKTREGGVMRLETLIWMILTPRCTKKSSRTAACGIDDAEKTSEIVGLSAVKYGDLSNQASKDYVFRYRPVHVI
jgi:arginyl-tRNA synthetase